MNAALRKVGFGLCIASILLGMVSVGSFWFTPTDSLGVGELHNNVVETFNESLRESLPGGHTLPNTRVETHRHNAWFGLIVSAISFVGGFLLHARPRRTLP